MYYYYHHRHHPYRNPSHHPHQNPSYHPHQNPSYHHHHLQNPSYHLHRNPSYHHHQNPSYYDQDPSYPRRRSLSYYDQNPSYHRPQSLSYHRRHHHHHQSPSYYDQNPSFYHRNYAYPPRRHHQHHHQNPYYDQIPHRHHRQHHRNHFYDQNLSFYHHHQQQQHCRNGFYDQIGALHCASSNPTTRLPVAEVKPKPEAPAVVVDFPLDVLILILARLPAKSLLKFRCVCKSWNSLIQQDRHFLALHQLHLDDNNSKKPPRLVTFFVTFRPPPGQGSDSVLNYSSSSDTTPYKFNFARLRQDPLYCMTNSCNGLLGVYSCYSFFIANPTIRKHRTLPNTWAAQGLVPQAALGFDASTGVYKVLRIFEREHEGFVPVRFGCEVCYLGGSGGWRLIDDPPVQPSYISLPVAVDGAIIWASETVWGKHLEVVALSFDLREEKFSVILHPEGSSRRTCPNSHVFASGGRIYVADEITSDVPSAHMNIWLLMKDDKKENSNKWVKQYVIDLTYVFQQMGYFVKAQPLTIDHNGRIVISWGRGRKDYYDPRTGSFDKHELDATDVDVEHVAPYTESMVWPWPGLCGVQ